MLDIHGLLQTTYAPGLSRSAIVSRILPHLFDAYGVEEAWLNGATAQGSTAIPLEDGSAVSVRYFRAGSSWGTSASCACPETDESTIHFNESRESIYARFGDGVSVSSEFATELERLEELTRRFELRGKVRKLSERRLGQDLALVGLTEPLLALEDRIEEAAASDLPVLVYGARGTEKTSAAFSILALGDRCDEPLSVIDCFETSADALESELEAAVEDARNGTLVLRRIEGLGRRERRLLPKYLFSRAGQWMNTGVRRDMETVRVIVTSAATPDEICRRCRDAPGLSTELCVFPIRVPTLMERRGDVRHFVGRALGRIGRDHRTRPELLAALSEYEWPGNVAELERVVARIVATHGADSLGVECLDGLHEFSRRRSTPSFVGSRWERMAAGAAHGDLTGTETLHPGLHRAILWISENSSENITTTTIARNAMVSSSHLSHLFKDVLETTVRTFLARVRIEKAKRLLAEDSNRLITEISLSVGFGDFSHFLKSFKRAVGVTPTSYRRRMRCDTDEALVSGEDEP